MIRRNPALLAAILSPPTAAPASDDANAAKMATRSLSGGPVGDTVSRGKPQSAPQNARALATALANAPPPAPTQPVMTPIGAFSAPSSPSRPQAQGARDPSIAGNANTSANQRLAQALAGDPGAAQRAVAISRPRPDRAHWRRRPHEDSASRSRPSKVSDAWAAPGVAGEVLT